MLAPQSPTGARARRARFSLRLCLSALVALAALGVIVAASASTSAKLLVGRMRTPTPPAKRHAAPVAPGNTAPARTTSPVPTQEQSVGARAFVTTDQTDYKPGETVVIFGNSWLPNELVTLTIHETSGAHADAVLTAEADEYGNILSKEFTLAEEHRGAAFTLTATGQTSGRTAEAKFTDGGVMSYSPNSVALTAFSGPGSSSSTSFTPVRPTRAGHRRDGIL